MITEFEQEIRKELLGIFANHILLREKALKVESKYLNVSPVVHPTIMQAIGRLSEIYADIPKMHLTSDDAEKIIISLQKL